MKKVSFIGIQDYPGNDNRFRFRLYDTEEKKYVSLCFNCRLHNSFLEPEGDHLILEQCTGLKDKNGKLIFEGDVVRYYRSTAMGLGGERIASVKWYDKYGAWGILTTLGDGYDMCDALRFGIEIIGNVHEMEVAK